MSINWHALVPYLLRAAPALATAVGSPVAGIVTGLVASAFNADPNNLNELITKISTDPSSEEKLAKLENDHADTIKSLLFARAPAKIDLHIVVIYDSDLEKNDVQGQGIT